MMAMAASYNQSVYSSGFTNTSSLSSHKTPFTHGWVSGPNTRGTQDIIWASFSTIFLCTWTAVCLNIPHPNDTKYQILFRKVKWMFWAVVGPELVLSVAIGQYASARRSVKRFNKLGHPEWTLRHAFFAEMGGILLQPMESKAFLVNSRQLAYLVQGGYVRYPEISAEEIWDKSKADTMTKGITLVQASWLVVQLCGRAIEGLAVTTLELSAAAIVFCTFGTFVCWLHKPSDVQKGITISSKATTAQILRDAGEAASEPYRHTPLDFVAKQSFTCSYDVMGWFGMRCDSRERPLRRFPNDRFPDISTYEKFALFCWTLAYAAFHLIGWAFEFPTRVELLLWRVSSLIVAGTTLFFWIFETVAARHRFGRWDKYLIWLHLKQASPDLAIAEAKTPDDDDAFEQEQKKSKPILIWEIALIMPIVFIYVAARTYMIVEVFASLRALPPAAFISVDFTQVFPHLM